MLFDGLYGQEQVKKVLTERLAGDRVGHAFVFSGPEGIGRKSFAEAFAAAVLCRDRPENGSEACGQCISCRLLRHGSNPDLIRIREEAGRSTLGVETVRAMQESLATAPEYGMRKFYIIDRAERLTPQAQNALLKTIEEPPEYAVLVLICSNVSMLVDTVRSRVVQVDFAHNRDEDVRRALLRAAEAAGQTVSEEEVSFICTYADGIIGRALAYSGEEARASLRALQAQTAECLALLPGGQAEFLLRLTALFKQCEDRKELLFFLLHSVFRDVMVSARCGNGQLQNTAFRDIIQRIGRSLGYHKAAACIDALQQAWTGLGRNVGYKLTAADLGIRLREIAVGMEA